MNPIVLLVVYVKLAQTTLIRYNNVTFKDDPILPLIDIPRILEDPQTVPIFNQRFFIFEDQGTLCLDLIPQGRLHDVWIMGFTETQWSRVKQTRIPYLLRSNVEGVTAHPNLPAVFRLPLNDGIHHCLDFQGKLKWTKYQRFYLLLLNPNKQLINLSGTVELCNHAMDRNLHSSLTMVAEEQVSLVGFLAFAFLAVSYLPLAYTLDPSLETLTPIHFLLAALTGLKAFYLGLNYIGYRAYAKHGEIGYFIKVIPKFLSRLEDVGMLLILLLIALGWHVYRSSLSLVEWRFYTGVALLSSYLALFEISIGGFQVSRYILAAVVYLCIMVAINFNITLLTSSLMDLPISLRAGKVYRRRRAYTQFRELFVLYIVKPSALLLFSLAVVGEEDALGLYILPAFDLSIDFVCLAGLMYVFRPITSTSLMKHIIDAQASQPITTSVIS